MRTFLTGDMEFPFSIFIISVLLSLKSKKRSHFLWKILAWGLLTVAGVCLIPDFGFTGMTYIVAKAIGRAAVLLVSFLIQRLAFQEEITKSLMKTFEAIALYCIRNYLTGLAKIFLGDSYHRSTVRIVVSVLLYGGMLVYLLCGKTRLVRKIKTNSLYAVVTTVAIVAAFCFTSVEFGVDLSAANGPFAGYYPFIFAAYTIFELLCISLLLVFGREEHLFDENKVLNSILEKERKQFEISRESVNAINLKYHDLKHLVSMLKASGGVFPEEELTQIEKSISDYGAMLKTGSEALDVVLAEKTLLAQREGISITCIADGQALGFMSKADVYVLFGNILENAMEAARRIQDSEKRLISLSVTKEMGVLHIREKNRRPDEPLRLENGIPVSTKGDSQYHGFGTLSIKTIAEKYGGVVNIAVSEEHYSLNIVIPLE